MHQSQIVTHRHRGSDEILFLQTGTARVHLGDSERVVHAGATVFIPTNTWISISNIGSDAISVVGVFSAPGFEDFERNMGNGSHQCSDQSRASVEILMLGVN